jgi:hypothetical protein
MSEAKARPPVATKNATFPSDRARAFEIRQVRAEFLANPPAKRREIRARIDERLRREEERGQNQKSALRRLVDAGCYDEIEDEAKH